MIIEITKVNGHAFTGVTKSIYRRPLPSPRAKAAKAMGELLYKDFVQVTLPRAESMATELATSSMAEDLVSDPIRDSVGAARASIPAPWDQEKKTRMSPGHSAHKTASDVVV
jgi:hypothetical protein